VAVPGRRRASAARRGALPPLGAGHRDTTPPRQADEVARPNSVQGALAARRRCAGARGGWPPA
jgi:hypothetical protein